MLYLRWRWLQWEDEEIQTQQYFVMVTPFNLRRLSDQNACIFYLKNGRYGCKVCTWFWGNFIPLSLLVPAVPLLISLSHSEERTWAASSLGVVAFRKT